MAVMMEVDRGAKAKVKYQKSKVEGGRGWLVIVCRGRRKAVRG